MAYVIFFFFRCSIIPEVIIEFIIFFSLSFLSIKSTYFIAQEKIYKLYEKKIQVKKTR